MSLSSVHGDAAFTRTLRPELPDVVCRKHRQGDTAVSLSMIVGRNTSTIGVTHAAQSPFRSFVCVPPREPGMDKGPAGTGAGPAGQGGQVGFDYC